MLLCCIKQLISMGCAGLVEDNEVESMNDLVEQKLKKLHYFPPQFHIHSPDTMLAAHPLLAGIPDRDFAKQVTRQALLFLESDSAILSIICSYELPAGSNLPSMLLPLAAIMQHLASIVP